MLHAVLLFVFVSPEGSAPEGLYSERQKARRTEAGHSCGGACGGQAQIVCGEATALLKNCHLVRQYFCGF